MRINLNVLVAFLLASISYAGMGQTNKRLVIGYFPSWSENWTSANQNSKLREIPAYVTHVFLAFAKPNLDYVSGSYDISQTGIQVPYDGCTLKESVAALKTEGIKVILSIGGETYWGSSDAYNIDYVKIKNLVDDMGFAGIDWDFEPNGSFSDIGSATNVQHFVDFFNGSRTVMPKSQGYILACAPSGVGAMGGLNNNDAASPYAFEKRNSLTGESDANLYNGTVATNGINLFGFSATGHMIPVIKSVGDKIDLIAFQGYNAGGSTNRSIMYDAFAYYAEQYGFAVAAGIHYPNEPWGPYYTYTHDNVASLSTHIKQLPQRTDNNDGIMIWQMLLTGSSSSAYSYLNVASLVFNGSSESTAIQNANVFTMSPYTGGATGCSTTPGGGGGGVYCGAQEYNASSSYAQASTKVFYACKIWSNQWYANPNEIPGVNSVWVEVSGCTEGPSCGGTSNISPAISITAPVNNASYMAPANVTITANVTDSDGSISKVEYYNGATLLGTVTTGSTYSYNWTNVAAGTYTITAKAYDNLNAVTTSSAITVKVNTNQVPTINITAPVNNVSYMAPANVTITANAADSDGSISKVEYYNGATLLGTVTTGSAYSYNWTNVLAGTYTITAKAYDNLNAVTTSSAITVKVNANQAPTVSITAPVNNASYMAPASITITANATDSDGSISKVEYYNGSTLLGTVTTGSTYSYNWTNVAAGTYTITAKAYDNLNAVTTSSAITVKVNTNQAPTVSITAPVNNASYMAPGSISITANATDSDGSISKVEYYNGSTLLGTVTTGSTYSYNWTNVAAGTYTITAKAYDNLNAVTTSSAITVKVNANQAPVVSITAPVNNASYMAPANVTITASATDSDGSISKVEYYNGATLLGTVTTGSIYSYNWTNVAAGTYTITAKAYDNLNAVTTSSAITVKVNANQAPVVSITAPVNNADVNVGESIAITAEASDADGSVVKVEFFNGSTKIGEVATSPYTINWSASNAGTYTIRAVATDNTGATSEDVITLHANIATGIQSAQTINLNFYPNPIKDILYFSTSVEQITVYSINGMVVKDISLNGMNYLTTSDLRSGMYVCEVVTQQGKAFIKILKE